MSPITVRAQTARGRQSVSQPNWFNCLVVFAPNAYKCHSSHTFSCNVLFYCCCFTVALVASLTYFHFSSVLCFFLWFFFFLYFILYLVPFGWYLTTWRQFPPVRLHLTLFLSCVTFHPAFFFFFLSFLVTASQWRCLYSSVVSLWECDTDTSSEMCRPVSALYLQHFKVTQWFFKKKKKKKRKSGRKQRCYFWYTFSILSSPPPPSPPPPPVDYWLAVIGEAEVTLVRRNERSGLFKKE